MQRSVPVFPQLLTMDQPSYNFSYPEERLPRKCSQVSCSSRTDRNSITATLFSENLCTKRLHLCACVSVRACVSHDILWSTLCSARSLQYWSLWDKKKFRRQLTGHFGFSAVFQDLYLFIPRLLTKPLMMFCEHWSKCNNYKFLLLWKQYGGADKSLTRLTSRCILFDGENISFDASIVLWIYSTNIPPIMIIITFCLMMRIFRLMLVFLYIYIYIYIVLILLQLWL